MYSGGNEKTTRASNRNSKKNSSFIVEKIEKMLEQKFKSYDQNMKSYLAANNELLKVH